MHRLRCRGPRRHKHRVQFDSVRINVADLAAATSEYERLLGRPAQMGAGVCRFQLTRGAVELGLGEPGLDSLCFAGVADGMASWAIAPDAFHGLRVRTILAHDAEIIAVQPDGVAAIDHVVIHSPDLDRAGALWRDRLGLRLALDREFPQRGLRMLFFRSAGVTLEFVGTLPAPADRGGSDRLSGIAYRVTDLAACRARLLRTGIEVSEIRRGYKPGTHVATVRSGTEGVPTLLISASDS